MTTIRPDARERIAEALVLLPVIEESDSREIRGQHIGRITRILEMCRDSIEEG
jgi:hypothetical protein